MVRRAASSGAALVVLPEGAMCPFEPTRADLCDLAETLDGPFVEAIAREAAQAGVTVVAGMFERSRRKARVHNTAVVVGPSGMIGCYRKFHLFDALGWRESASILAGDPAVDGVTVFDLDGLRFGVMTCYDLRFPEMARALVDAGTEVLLVCAQWIAGPGKADTWRTLLRARAIESTAYAVAAAQPSPGCTGHSMIVDPKGRVLAELDARARRVVLGQVDQRRVREVRDALPVLDARLYSVMPWPTRPQKPQRPAVSALARPAPRRVVRRLD
jgi:predicted amidohydrolase